MGQKIKELRLARGMTQAELAGETVTRNMLSQIENGVAKPSVTTIRDIATKLGVPTEYFFSESRDLGAFLKLSVIPKVRKLFAAGEYAKCLTKLENLGASDDETELLFSKCAMALGIAAYHTGCLTTAEGYFHASITHAQETIYAEASMTEIAEKYLSAIAFVRRGEKPMKGSSVCGGQAVFADLVYIGRLSGVEFSDPSEGIASGYATHLNLRQHMKAGAYPTAEDELHALLESHEGKTDAILRYYVLGDLESVAKQNGDYKAAYECSAERLALAEKMNQ